MRIFRGIKDLLFEKVNPLFKNDDLSFLDYGRGTSYAYEKYYAEEYCSYNKKFGWLGTYDFQPKNPLYINNYHFIDEEDSAFGYLIDKEHVERGDLSKYGNQKGYDCVIFQYDCENDPHILLLDRAQEPVLIELELHTENQEIVESIKTLNIPFDGIIFLVPLNRIKEVDSLLKSLNL